MDIATMTDNLLNSQAFKLKGRLYTLTVMHLVNLDLRLFEQQLTDVVAKAPRLFDKAPVVVDCAGVESDKIDLLSICQIMRGCGLMPVAIQGGGVLVDTIAQCNGLAVLKNSSSTSSDRELISQQSNIEQPTAETIKSKLLTAPVRSGQQVVSKGGDLVITATVSRGAELLADGNIHVYGALRGRALAGISGDKQARIFCQSLDAELVSIAGYYRLSDVMDPIPGPCQIFLQDEHIQIEPL
jgi:septum site-determining protein MinC